MAAPIPVEVTGITVTRKGASKAEKYDENTELNEGDKISIAVKAGTVKEGTVKEGENDNTQDFTMEGVVYNTNDSIKIHAMVAQNENKSRIEFDNASTRDVVDRNLLLSQDWLKAWQEGTKIGKEKGKEAEAKELKNTLNGVFTDPTDNEPNPFQEGIKKYAKDYKKTITSRDKGTPSAITGSASFDNNVLKAVDAIMPGLTQMLSGILAMSDTKLGFLHPGGVPVAKNDATTKEKGGLAQG